MKSLTRKPPVTWAGNYIRERKPYCTTKGIDLNDYEIIGYWLGTRIHYLKGLSWYHFDTATLIENSTNQINGITGYCFHTYRHTGPDGKARPNIIIAVKKESNTVVIADKIK